MIKLKIDEEDKFSNDAYKDSNLSELKEIEFEVIFPEKSYDNRRVEIYNDIESIEDRLSEINQEIEELNIEINRLTCSADGLDYTISVASGVIAGAIDIFFVGEFSFDNGKKWSGEKVNSFVMEIAKRNGFDEESYRGKNNLKGAIKFLEDKYHIPSDGVWNTGHYGMNGISHHLDDWSHHPSILGLISSILTQFTGKGYFSNKYGENITIDVPISLFKGEKEIILIGNNISTKIFCGVFNWAMHLVSDMAGSSSNPGAGMGIPGPVITLLKEFSVISGFNKTDLPKIVGDVFEKNRLDLRGEFAIAHELGKQSIPVIINEALVRAFYFISRLIGEIKEKKSFSKIEWKKTLPFKNRTIVRMMTIATGTFMAIDMADAGIRAVIKSGGFNPATLGCFVLRVNFVGAGRFAIAISTDAGMGIKKSKKENEKMRLRGEELQLLNAKVFYKESDMWIEAENADKVIEEAYVTMEEVAVEFLETWNEIESNSEQRTEYIDKIRENDSEFAKELSEMLDWGI